MLTLSRTLATRLLKHAQDHPAQRIGGLLLARNGQPSDILPLRNVATDTAAEHAFDPAEFRAAREQANADGLKVLALYCSHPDSPPVPDDSEWSARPDTQLPLLVISLDTKGVLEMRAFYPQDEDILDTPVQIFL